MAAAVGGAPVLAIEQEVVPGFPVQVLNAEAARAQLVVLGDRGLGGFTGLLAGSARHRVDACYGRGDRSVARRAGAIQVRASFSMTENMVSGSGRSQRSAATRAAPDTAAASTSGPSSP